MNAPGAGRAVEPRPDGDDPESPFIDIWGMLLRRRGWVAGSFVVGLWLAGLFLMVATPPYKSEAQILIIQKDPNLPAKGVDRGGEFDKEIYEGLLPTHLQLLRSPGIVKRAIRQQRLDLLPSLENARAEDDPDGSKYIIENLEVTIGNKEDPSTEGGHVLHLSFHHNSGADAATILRAILESYSGYTEETYHDVSKEAVTLMRQAQVELARDLKKEEESYLSFLAQAPLQWRGDGGKSANIHQDRLQKIEASLSDVRLRYTQAQARLGVIEAALRGSTGAGAAELERLVLLDDKEVSRLTLLLSATKQDSDTEAFQASQPNRTEAMRTKYEQYLAQLGREQSLLMNLGPDHPRVREAREATRLTREFLEKNAPSAGDTDPAHSASPTPGRIKPAELVDAYVGMLRHDLAELDRSRLELERLSEEEARAAKTLLGYELRGESIRQEVTRKRALYDGVIDRLRQINLIKDFAGFITEVVAPVQVGEPVSKWVALVLAVGSVLGLGSGLVLAWGADRRDRTLHGPGDLRRLAPGLPALARLPAGAATARADALRALRAALGHAGWGGRYKVLQVTGPDLDPGRTPLVADLAALMARSGRRVLAIDADLNRPALREALGLPPGPGLSDVLAGSASLDDAVRPTTVEGLDLLGGGSPPDGPTEWLASPHFAQLIESLRPRYDAIIVDCPALLEAADAAELARHVDGVLLTVRVARTEGPRMRRAGELLAGVGANVLGVVVDGCETGDS